MSYLASLQELNRAAVSEGREVFTPHGDSSLGLEDRYESTFLRITLCHSLRCAPHSALRKPQDVGGMSGPYYGTENWDLENFAPSLRSPRQASSDASRVAK